MFLEIASAQKVYPWVGAQRNNQVEHLCLFPGASVEQLGEVEIARRILTELERIRPGALFVSGYDRGYYRQAARWAKQHCKASVLCTDSWDNVWGRRRNPLKEWAKRKLVTGLFDAAFAAGERSARYANSLGIPYCKVWRGVDAVENSYFAVGADNARADSRLRQEKKLPSDYFLFVGRLIECKNLFRLLDAFEHYVNGGGRWDLVFVGDGELRAKLEARASQGPLARRVQIRAWASYEELPTYYGLARCFILASTSETWGLVVNEAMAAGLPVLLSSQVGCMPEFCQNGINGYVFDPADAPHIAECMKTLSESTNHEEMGQASRRIVANWDTDVWAKSVQDCAAVLRRG